MRLRCALLVSIVLLTCIGHAGAVLVTFTGNVDTDFGAVPGIVSRPDTVGDDKGPAGGCDDEPLGMNSFDGAPVGPIPSSGFNIERVVTAYDCTTDTLFIGLDVCDGKIAWDADGNGNILTKNPSILGPPIVQPQLKGLFSDEISEDYQVELDVKNDGTTDLRILVRSDNGGTTIATTNPISIAGVTVDSAITGPDVELVVHGLRAKFPPPPPGLAIQPIRISTRSGAIGDLVNEDVTNSLFDLPCTACISITKGVSCSANGPFLPSVQALRGATVYFQIAVTNCGSDNLKDVVISDNLASSGACCTAGSCIPVTINVGNLAAGETKTYTYPVPTNAAFSTTGVAIDCTNTASVTGVGVLTNINVNAGPVSATVDVLVPAIACSKLIDNDTNFATDPTDTKPPSTNFNLSGGGNAYYQLCVENTGESPVDFNAGTNPNCPSFNDAFLETVDAQIPGTGANLDTLFRNQLQTQFGRKSLLPSERVCIVVGPIAFNEGVLCPFRHEFADEFSACGIATGTNICLPPGGGENVSTGICQATVRICPPCIDIDKKVSCSPTGPWTSSVSALRGATIYFQVTVENCGGEVLNNVTITDTMTDTNNALLDCAGCTNGLTCLPSVTNIGSLGLGESKSFVCTFPTNPAFATTGITPDATNTVSVSATSAGSQTVVTDGPVSAEVDVLVPSITCEKLLADNAGFLNPTQHLNLSDNVMDVEQAWYRFCVTNTGETAVSFAAGASPSCPSFTDTFLKSGGTSIQTCAGPSIVIPGTNQDLNALFRAQLQSQYGSHSLPAGGSVCIAVGPVSFNENQLCCVQKVFPDTFTACGFATGTNICLPPSGGENVNTGNCTADVTICSPPRICIEKEVSCSPDTGFGPSVTALRGADVYFRITVTNCGGDNLKDVVITDTLADANNALLDCTGCTGTASCIPGEIIVGNLAVGESKTIVCTFPTNPAFAVEGISPDATNTVTVVGTSVRTSEVVMDGPSMATVDVLVPSITCNKLVDDDSNFGDPEVETNNLDLSTLPMGIKSVWYELCVENTGEVPVNFGAETNADCPSFTDEFLETVDPQIPGTGVDLDALFRAKLLSRPGGGLFLQPNEKVCIVVGGDEGIRLDESVLCPDRHVLTDQFEACGIATDDDICLPSSGGEEVSTGICEATVRICPACITITKGVACDPAGPFGPAVTALRGATLYFKVTVTNCGGEVLNSVTVTDALTDTNNALLNCTGCTGIASTIPSVINLGSLNPGESKDIVCTFPTNPAFAVEGISPDAANTASVTAVSAITMTNVHSGPVSATVDVVSPSITCELLMDDDDNLGPDAADMTPPDNNLNLAVNGPAKVEQIWCSLMVKNTGEVECNFAVGPDADCPSFWDPFLSTADAAIPGTGIDVAQAFRDALQTAYGGHVLPADESVTITLGPIVLDEPTLCPNRTFFVNRFKACGIATENDICLPPSGGEILDTGMCQGTIMICEPVLFQAYPGDSNGTNIHYSGYLGKGGETISAVPGVFVLEPGEAWSNFVTAAQVGFEYTLKNVSLVKETPEFIQCADVFTHKVIQQQSTAAIRLRWPLMYEAPGTRWTLTIHYGTSVPWDDDGIDGPHVPSYTHEDEWSWKVDASLYSMKLLLDLFRETPFGLDEVPLISDEDLYLLLQQKLDETIALYEANRITEAADALGDFEMEVTDACIATSPRSPYPGGPGTGIAGSLENPACCKLLVDAEFVGLKLGLFQATK